MVRGAMLRVVFSVRSGVDEEIFQWCTGTGVFVVLDMVLGEGGILEYARCIIVNASRLCMRARVKRAGADESSRRKHRGDNRPD